MTHRYAVDALVRCKSGDKLGHLFAVVGEVDDNEAGIDIRRVELIHGGKRKDMNLSRLPAYIGIACEEAIEAAYLDDMRDREQQWADIDTDLTADRWSDGFTLEAE